MTAAASRALGWLDRFPYAVLAAVLRLAVAEVFWSSGQSRNSRPISRRRSS